MNNTKINGKVGSLQNEDQVDLCSSIDTEKYQAIKNYIKLKFKMKDPLVTSFDAIDNLYLKEKLEGEEHSGAHGENSRYKLKNSDKRKALQDERTLGGMEDMLEIEELLGSNLGEMLKLRQFNIPIPSPWKYRQFDLK